MRVREALDPLREGRTSIVIAREYESRYEQPLFVATRKSKPGVE